MAGEIESFATNLSNSIAQYMGMKTQNDLETAKETRKNNAALNLKTAEAGLDTKKKNDEELYKHSLEDNLTPDIAEKWLPGFGGNMVTTYNAQRSQQGLPPLKMKDAHETFKDLADQANPDDSKELTRQDRLEQQARQMQNSIRGDTSLIRTETQRDASGQAYDTLANVKAQGRPLSELEYTDLLGQLWKARTGASPNETEMKALKASTGQGDINKIYQYFSGNPVKVGAAPDAVVQNLQDFIVQSGTKVDEQHQGYWDTRLKKPTGLDQDRWDAIKNETRGHSFADQKALSDKKYNSVAIESKKQALRLKLGL